MRLLINQYSLQKKMNFLYVGTNMTRCNCTTAFSVIKQMTGTCIHLLLKMQHSIDTFDLFISYQQATLLQQDYPYLLDSSDTRTTETNNSIVEVIIGN